MYLFKVKDNQIIFSSKEAEGEFRRLLSSFNNTGKTLQIHIEVHSAKTSEAQMNLFKAMIIAGKEHTGMSYSEFESELVSSFAPFKYESNIIGEKTKTRIPPNEMTNYQFQSFIEESVRFMNEFFEMNFKLYSDVDS